MSISIDEVRHIAKLAKLQFTDAEEKVIAQELSKILNSIDTLNEIDTSGITPLTRVHDLTQTLRPDSVKERVSHEDALGNAPDTDGEYFRVPKVIG